MCSTSTPTTKSCVLLYSHHTVLGQTSKQQVLQPHSLGSNKYSNNTVLGSTSTLTTRPGFNKFFNYTVLCLTTPTTLSWVHPVQPPHRLGVNTYSNYIVLELTSTPFPKSWVPQVLHPLSPVCYKYYNRTDLGLASTYFGCAGWSNRGLVSQCVTTVSYPLTLAS